MSRKILWVEDDPSFRNVMGPLLEKKRFHILPTTRLDDALRLYSNNLSDLALIIADAGQSGLRERELAELNFKSKMTPFLLFASQSDAENAVELLDFGVRDYLTKPVTAEKFMAVVNNALTRDHRPHGPAAGGRGLDAGTDHLVIRSRSDELDGALEWIRKRTLNCFIHGEMDKFLCFVNEYLLNAHEHGNLRISEEEKINLLERDLFIDEVRRREDKIDAKIEISVAINGQKVAINISDEGSGFDYGKYMGMDKSNQMSRLFSPCGRGILITCHYFDSIEFTRGGRSVTLTKALQVQNGV